MRREIVDAERREAVRAAAHAWRRAGWITPQAETEIARRFADDRQRMGPALRTLLWCFTLFAISSGMGTLTLLLSAFEIPFLLLLATAIACGALAEVAYGPMRLLDFGPESALAWSAVGNLIAAAAWVTFEWIEPGEKLGLLGVLGVAAVILGLGAWRWGSWMMAGLASGAVLGILAGLPGGRLGWIAGGALALLPSARAARDGRLAPSHRRGFLAVFLVALVAIGVALFPPSHQGRWIERAGLRGDDPSPLADPVAWIGFLLYAAAVLAGGVRWRRRSLLQIGSAALIVGAVAGLDRVDAGPLWLLLAGGGALLVGGALVLRRWLDAGARQERRGITTAPLLEDPEARSALEAIAAVATATPAAREPAAAPGLQGKGGDFGGGGASTGFGFAGWGTVALLALLPGALSGCGEGAKPPGPKPLETVEVMAPPDAHASTAGDPQESARRNGFSGVLPPGAPAGLPLEPGASLVDFGSTPDGAAYLVLRLPRAIDSARREFPAALRRGGWQPLPPAAGDEAGRESLQRAGRTIEVSFEAAGPASQVRIEY